MAKSALVAQGTGRNAPWVLKLDRKGFKVSSLLALFGKASKRQLVCAETRVKFVGANIGSSHLDQTQKLNVETRSMLS